MSLRSRRPVKVGLLVPTMEGMMSGGLARWSDLKAVAQHAEAVGFDSLWVNDHLIYGQRQPGVPPALGLWEGWSILASLVAVVPRVEFGTIVTCTGFRNPALLAKMADTVDEVSGGRLILGLGAGYYEPEYRAFGYPYDHRVGRFEEALQIIRTLLRDGRIDFSGEFYQARDCELRPRSSREGGPPIMIGARPERRRALRLAAQYADYWNLFGIDHPDGIAPARQAMDAACVRLGRDPTTLARTVSVLIDLPGLPRAPDGSEWAGLWSSFPRVTGTPAELAELLRAVADQGVDHVQVALEPSTMAGIDAFTPVLELLDQK
jgi:alkanesulfonate monooxygenase SsuD/methylene tetrahydromethanopterin reductase-like flavin-dependent oxidoreductase (luciferase family)